MRSVRTRLVFVFLFCACAASIGGCTTPFAKSATQHPPPPQTTAMAATAAKVTPMETVAQPDSDSDIAGVLDKLQQVRAIDPAAEQKLIDELRRTPAKSWPLVAEQFRTSLAYREQLAATSGPHRREGAPSTEGQIVVDGSRPEKGELQLDRVSQRRIASQQLFAADRPSAPIGELVDPRSADADGVSSEALAAATPYSTPAPIAKPVEPAPSTPRQFTSDDDARPIELGGVRTAVVPSRHEAASESSAHEIENALGEQQNPSRAMPAGGWQQLIEQAADDLDRRVVDAPSTTAEVHQHVSLRMLRLLGGDTEQALEPIPHVSPTEQDFWSRQLFGLATYLDHHAQPDDSRRAAASVTHFDEAVSHLRELGSLSLRNLSFCKKVYGYGSIEPFDRDEFSPGQQVSLYVEVENYHSQSTEQGFCTLLGSTYGILDESGKRVGGSEFPDVEDCCRSRRRDFHIQYGLSLPEKLSPGRYRLELVVKDRQSDKLGHASVEFEIRRSYQSGR